MTRDTYKKKAFLKGLWFQRDRALDCFCKGAWQQAGRHGAGVVAENLHFLRHDHKAERDTWNGMDFLKA